MKVILMVVSVLLMSACALGKPSYDYTWSMETCESRGGIKNLMVHPDPDTVQVECVEGGYFLAAKPVYF